MSRRNISLQTRLTLLIPGSVLLFGLAASYTSYKDDDDCFAFLVL